MIHLAGALIRLREFSSAIAVLETVMHENGTPDDEDAPWRKRASDMLTRQIPPAMVNHGLEILHNAAENRTRNPTEALRFILATSP